MPDVRMPRGDYTKMLFRIPDDVRSYLQARSEREVRSVNAELVYIIRQLMKQEAVVEHATMVHI